MITMPSRVASRFNCDGPNLDRCHAEDSQHHLLLCMRDCAIPTWLIGISELLVSAGELSCRCRDSLLLRTVL